MDPASDRPRSNTSGLLPGQPGQKHAAYTKHCWYCMVLSRDGPMPWADERINETSSWATTQLQMGQCWGSSRTVLRRSLLSCRIRQCRTIRENQTWNKLGREKEPDLRDGKRKRHFPSPSFHKSTRRGFMLIQLHHIMMHFNFGTEGEKK